MLGEYFGQMGQFEKKAQRGETANRTVHSKNTSSAPQEVIAMVVAQSGRWGSRPSQGLELDSDSEGNEDSWWVLNRLRLVSLGFK